MGIKEVINEFDANIVRPISVRPRYRAVPATGPEASKLRALLYPKSKEFNGCQLPECLANE